MTSRPLLALALLTAALHTPTLAQHPAGTFVPSKSSATAPPGTATKSSNTQSGPQSTAVILPAAQANSWGNSNNAIPFSTDAPVRYQQVFVGTDLPSQLTVQSLSLRRDDQVTGYSGSAAEVEVRMGYTTRGPSTLTDDFAKNADAGPLQPVFLRKKIRLPDMPSSGPSSPQAFFLTLCFDVPFSWTQQNGRNLLLEIRVHSNSSSNRAFWYQFDAVANSGGTSRLLAWGSTLATTGVLDPNVGLVVQLGDQKCANNKPVAYYESFGTGCAGTGGAPGFIVPKAARTGFGGDTGWGALSTDDCRMQQEIDASQMPAQATKIISYAERKDTFAHTHAAKSFPLKLLFGMTTYDKNTLTTSFATNANRPQTVVFDGIVNLPASSGSNHDPNRFLYEIKLRSPYLYVPKAGENFLVEYQNRSASQVGAEPYVDWYWYQPEAHGSIVYDTSANVASGTLYPNCSVVCRFGTESATGSAIPTIDNVGRPVLGQSMQVRLFGSRANSAALFVYGFSDTTWGPIPLPFDLAPLGAPGCRLLAAFDFPQAVATDSFGVANAVVSVPNVPAFAGLQFHNQFAVVDSGANASGLAWSNAKTATLHAQ